MTRKIIHIDMDAFFASVEQRDDPELRGKPVAVGFSSGLRGVVAAASYEARRFGVRSAMPAVVAQRRCPHLLWVRPRFDTYRAISRVMRGMLADYTDLIEPLSLDECYLDVTHNKAGVPYAAKTAALLRERIRDELRLTASAGVAPVKFVAKIASDHRKPDGLTVITPERVLGFIHPLPVERLWGVGPVTRERLHRLGLRTIGDVARRDRFELARRLGKLGVWLHRLSNGDDPRAVKPDRVRKSRGAERTFRDDLRGLPAVREALSALLDRVIPEVAARDERPRTLTVKIRYDDFTTVTRSSTLDPTALLASFEEVAHALAERTEAEHRPVRLVGVTLSNFEDTRQAKLPLL